MKNHSIRKNTYNYKTSSELSGWGRRRNKWAWRSIFNSRILVCKQGGSNCSRPFPSSHSDIVLNFSAKNSRISATWSLSSL